MLLPVALAAFAVVLPRGARAPPLVRPSRHGPVVASAVRVGIVGGGTVGGGIAEILASRDAFLRDSLGITVQIAKLCVRDASKARDFALPAGCAIVTDVSDVLDDADIDMVVEVMGGVTLAKEVVTRAIKGGKHVVTANKALIAQDLPELNALLTEVNANREGSGQPPVQFGFEAAVCGGIPIIHALQRDFLADEIVQISGIINGCTNFILSSMAAGGKSYTQALDEASALGYAEADPTLDVGGFDARSKLRILMKLAFGLDVNEEEIPCRGITAVTSTDFEYAKLLDGTVKLLGIAKIVGEDRISAFVSPVFVPETSTLAGVNGATNAVQVSSSSLQSSVFVGQGAGRFPTANSCVTDILDICRGISSTPFPRAAPGLKFVNSYTSSFYIRVRFRDRVGIIKDIGGIFDACGVSIYSILQNPIEDPADAQYVIITDDVSVGSIKQVCVQIEETDWCLGETFYMPVL